MTTADLVQAAAAALKGATVTGDRVFAPRDWPTWDGIYPAILVSAPLERKAAAGRGTPQFTTTTTLRIWVRASAPGATLDGTAGKVEAQLWTIQRQIEVALINAPGVFPGVQQIASVSTQLAFDSSAAQHLGAIVMDLELEFFQGPDAFAPLVSTEMDELDLTLTNYPPTGAVIPTA